jgi:hypothetical protein
MEINDPLIEEIRHRINSHLRYGEGDEQLLESGMIWFRIIPNQLPFFMLPKMLEEEDIWFDNLFAHPPLIFIESSANGTLFYNALQLLVKCYERNAPMKENKVTSRIHFDANGNPDNLTNVFKVLVKAFREFMIIKYMIHHSPLLKELHPDFLFSMANFVENNFARNPTADLDVIMPAEVFVRLVCIFRKDLPLIYYRQMTGAYIYQKISEKILSRLNKIDIDFNNPFDSTNKAEEIEQLAISITHEIDRFIRRDVEGYSVKSGSAVKKSIPGRKLLNNAFFAFQEETDEEIIDIYSSEVNNTSFIVHIVKARHLPNRFRTIQNQLNKYTSEVTRDIFKLKSKNQQNRKFLSYCGLLNIQNAYRKNLEDTRFFSVNEKVDRWSNAFDVFFLIDNSCTIPPKVNTLQQVLVLLTSVISTHPDIFPTIHAYAQKGSNKTVYLTPLIEGDTALIKNWGSLIYYNCKMVNYDPFALFEILRRNENLLSPGNRIQLVFVVGDAWPVSMENNVKDEGKKIMTFLRNKFPKMVIIDIASNPLYIPEDLGYDYCIRLNSDSFSIASFNQQFKNVILKVIEDYVFN